VVLAERAQHKQTKKQRDQFAEQFADLATLTSKLRRELHAAQERLAEAGLAEAPGPASALPATPRALPATPATPRYVPLEDSTGHAGVRQEGVVEARYDCGDREVYRVAAEGTQRLRLAPPLTRGLTRLAGVTTRPAAHPSGGIPPATGTDR
jgi:hypothetical protein